MSENQTSSRRTPKRYRRHSTKRRPVFRPPAHPGRLIAIILATIAVITLALVWGNALKRQSDAHRAAEEADQWTLPPDEAEDKNTSVPAILTEEADQWTLPPDEAEDKNTSVPAILAEEIKPEGNVGDIKTVAVCNGFEIPYEELRFLTVFYKKQLAEQYGDDIWDDPAIAENHRAELEKLVKENLNQNYVVLSAAKQLGIATSGKTVDNYIDQQIKGLKAEFNSTKEYKQFLKENGMSENYLRFTLSIGFIESAIHYTLLDNDVYMFRYEDNSAAFVEHVLTSGEYVRTLHVYIENAANEDPAANLATAQKISDTLKAAESVGARRSMLYTYIGSAINDDLMTVTGDGYYFTRGEMVQAYEDASFALEIGEVSDPVVCSGGNFVIMRLEPEETYVQNNVKELMDAYYGVCLNDYIEVFRPMCDVFFTEYGKTIDLLTME